MWYDERITRIEIVRDAYGEGDEGEPDITLISYEDMCEEMDRVHVEPSEFPSDTPRFLTVYHEQNYRNGDQSVVSYHPAHEDDQDLIHFAYQGAKSGNFEDRLPKYTSVGSYSIVYFTPRNEVMCAVCASRLGLRESDGQGYWEGPPLDCEECGDRIESSYGDPSEEE